MSPSVNEEFIKLERQLDDLLQLVRPLSHAQQNFKPDPESWSILQVFRHMIQSEGQINNYLRKKILGAKTVGKAGLAATIRSFILNTAMRLSIRYKVPDAIKVDFEETYEFEQLAAEWRSLRSSLKSFLETLDDETSRKEIFRHPSVGRMSVVQGLSFMNVHLDRHTQQVKKVMMQPGFPK
jgi:DinB superfamily